MKIRIVLIISLLSIAVTLSGVTAFAHERDEHDRDISLILFGDENYKASHPNVSEVIEALEDATYLAVDQFNGKGQDALNYLRSRKIPDIPSSIKEIDFTSNYSHRSMTHRGWNFQYPESAHWKARKMILMNTVEHELFIDSDTALSWFPWLSEKLYGRNGTEIQQENFCILLYYTHLIGDHIEAKKYQDLSYVAPLIRPNDRNNPGIIPELLLCLDSLFEDQRSTYTYSGMIQELRELQYRSEALLQSTGGINTEEKFIEYHKCAIMLFKTLELNIPKLLKNELFFQKCLCE